MPDQTMLQAVQAAICNALEDLLTELGLDPNDYPSDDGHYRESYGDTLYRAAAEAVLPMVDSKRVEAASISRLPGVEQVPTFVEWHRITRPGPTAQQQKLDDLRRGIQRISDLGHNGVTPSAVWQVVEAVDYEPDQEIATFTDEAAANRLAERLREHFRETPVREVAVRRFPIVADPDAVEIMTHWSLSGPVTKEPEGPWPTVLVEGLDSEQNFADASTYTAGVVVVEEDADETWRGGGIVHYISVDGPTSEAVRDAWNAARDAYLARD